jgi:hypothetical protein
MGIIYPNSNTLVGVLNTTANWVPSGNKGGVVSSYSITSANQITLNKVGLYFNSGNGTIYGAPTSVLSTTIIAVTAINASGSQTLPVSLRVNATAATGVAYPNSNVLVWTKGTGQTFMPSIANYSGPSITGYSLSSADSATLTSAGLTLDASSGEMGGTPTAVLASSPITVTVTNGTTNPTVSVTVQVNDQAPEGVTYPNSNILIFTKGGSVSASPSSGSGGAVTSFSISSTSISALSAVGISFNASTGAFSASSLSALLSTITVNVTASNSTGSVTIPVAFTVNDVAPNALTYPNSNVLTATKNRSLSSYSPSGNTGGAVLSYSLDAGSQSLFATLGLSFDTITGAITGTPTAVHSLTALSVTATNSGGSQLLALTMIVNDLLPAGIAYPNSSSVTSTKGSFISLTPTSGTGGTATTFTVSGNSATLFTNIGLSLNPTTGVISGTLLTTQSATTASIVASNATGSQNLSLSITIADAVPSGITYPSSNTLVATKGIATSFSPSSSLGGTPVTYAISPSLVTPGLSFSTSSGVISGTATATLASTQYVILAQNATGSQSITVYLSVNDSALNAVAYNINNVLTGTVGSAFSYTPSGGSGGTPTGYSISNAQNTSLTSAGLSFNTTTGAVAGTNSGAPTAALSIVLSVTASNGTSSYTIPVTITINPLAPVTITYPSSGAMTAAKGAAFSFSPTVSSGGTPTSYTISAGVIAALTGANVSFSTSTGVFSATVSPATTVLSPTTFSILAANSGGSILVNVSLTINDIAPAGVTYASATNALSVTAGAGGSFSPAAGTGGTTTSFAFNAAGSAASIVYGVALNASTGVITVPTSANVAVSGVSFGVIAANSGGNQTITLSLTVKAASVSIANSTVVASPSSLTADGATMTTITVTLKDAYGNPAPAGKSVSLTSSRGATDTIATSPSSTNASGQVTFSAKSSTAGSSTFTAVDATDLTSSSPASNTVTFTAGAASAIAISGGNNQSIAAGGTLSTLFVTVTDAKGNLVGNQLVTWAITSGSGSLPATSSITNSTTGIATLVGTPFTLTTAAASTQTITATIGGTSTSVAFTTTVTAGAPSLTYSTLTTSNPTLPPDNTTTATLSATIKDSYNNPVSGNVVNFSQIAQSGTITATLSATSATTNALGVAAITIKSANAGFTIISAATSGTVITLPSIDQGWLITPNLSTTPSNYFFGTNLSPAMNVTNTGSAITSCSITPALPSSLSFNTTTCQITPTTVIGYPMKSSYTITASNSIGSNSITVTIAAFLSNYTVSGSTYTATATSYGGTRSGYAGTSCVLSTAGNVTCTGTPTTALELGSSVGQSNLATPTQVFAGTPISMISGGMNQYCYILSTGSLQCVGGFATDRPADNGNNPCFWQSSTPVTMGGLTTPVQQISCAGNWCCAVSANKTMGCFGYNYYYQLGNTSTESSGSSFSTVGLAANVVQCATGGVGLFSTNWEADQPGGSCALLVNGTVQCWGDYTSSTYATPTTISGITTAVAITGGGFVGGAGFCATLQSGAVSCWGGPWNAPGGWASVGVSTTGP